MTASEREAAQVRVESALESGELSAVEAAVRLAGRSLRTFRFNDGATLLHIATERAPTALLRSIIGVGVDVNAIRAPDGWTALHMAASNGRLAAVEALLDAKGVDDTLVDVNGKTAADVARNKTIETAFLIAQSRFIESTIVELHTAVNKNDITRLKSLMENGRAKRLVDVNTTNGSGETILHRAVKGGKAETIKACLALGADPFAKNRRGKMPIELTHSEEIRNLLKQAPMVKSKEIPTDTSTSLSGYLLKYVNFASGYKRRFVVLEDGILSYYKDKGDYPVSCKGSVNVQFAKLVCPPGDRVSFELRMPKCSLYFRAEAEGEASRWVMALGRWQLHLSETTEQNSPASAIIAADTLRRRSQTCAGKFGANNYRQTLQAAHTCLDQLEAHLIRAASEALPSNVQATSAPDTVSQQLLQSLHEFFRLCDAREEYWTGRVEAEIRQRAMVEEALIKLRRTRGLVITDSRQQGGSDDTIGVLLDEEETLCIGFEDEFYDALDERMMETSLNASMTEEDNEEEKEEDNEEDNEEEEEAKENHDKIKGENEKFEPEECNDKDLQSELTPTEEEELGEKLSAPTAEILEEPRGPEMAVPVEDLEFISKNLTGYEMVRRDRIPVESTAIPPISIWNIIKSAIGKDLTRIPVPVNFSEPISMLQRLCEDLEYADLLYMASTATDPLLRLQYVAAFAVSSYASSDGRISKPFNPLLGETFEYVSHEHGFRYLAEQVSHHPPISACYCESARFIYYAEVAVKTKFWKSLELVPDGLNHVILKDTGEHFSWKKVTTAVYNLIMGKMWLDHYGTLKVTNHKTATHVDIEFKATGWRTSDPRRLEGVAYDSDESALFRLSGYWHRYLRTVNLKSKETIELWRRRPVPPWSPSNYNFTYFTMTLNESSPNLLSHLPPTDARHRPDQRAMEEGHFDEANSIKVSLEERQRAQRRVWEATPGFVYDSRWFIRDVDLDSKESYWRYLGGYWESRQVGEWKGCQDIYGIIEGKGYEEGAQLLPLNNNNTELGHYCHKNHHHDLEDDNHGGNVVNFESSKYTDRTPTSITFTNSSEPKSNDRASSHSKCSIEISLDPKEEESSASSNRMTSDSKSQKSAPERFPMSNDDEATANHSTFPNKS